MDSFFIVGDELDVDSRNDQGTAHSEPLKDQEEDITVDTQSKPLRLKTSELQSNQAN